jgi:hypothetical protein
MKLDKNIIIQYFAIPIIIFLISSYFIYFTKVVDFLIQFKSAYPAVFSHILGVIIGLIYLLIGIAKKGLLANKAGIFFYSSNNNNKAIKKSGKFLKSKSAVAQKLYILGATGLKTFAETEAPLYNSLKKCPDIRIILANPDSQAIKKRCNQIVGIDIEEYKREIFETLEQLTELHKTNDNIKVKFYSSEMLWKFIIIDNYVWVQQYSQLKHVKNAACYAFERTDKNDYEDIYNYLYRQFIKKWRNKRLKYYDFASRSIKDSV